MSDSNNVVGILTASDVLSLLDKPLSVGGITIGGFEREYLRPTCYDFACDYVLVSAETELPQVQAPLIVRNGTDYKLYRFNSLRLKSFQFCKFVSKEKFALPRDVVGHLYLRSKYARLGLVPVLIGRVEAGWSGRLVLELLNASTTELILESGVRLASIEFVKLHKEVDDAYNGSYMNFASEITDK